MVMVAEVAEKYPCMSWLRPWYPGQANTKSPKMT